MLKKILNLIFGKKEVKEPEIEETQIIEEVKEEPVEAPKTIHEEIKKTLDEIMSKNEVLVVSETTIKSPETEGIKVQINEKKAKEKKPKEKKEKTVKKEKVSAKKPTTKATKKEATKKPKKAGK
jgi:hypothetical protein